VPASLHNALLVLAVQSISTLLPLTPGGVGTQQGLLVYVYDRAGTGIAGSLLLSFSIGMYISTTILAAVVGSPRSSRCCGRSAGAGNWSPGREPVSSRGLSARSPHPVRIIVTDDLRRSRLTVFFRALLAIPHYIWVFLIGQAVVIVVFVNWFILLFKGTDADGFAQLRGRLSPLPDAPRGVLPARSRPVSPASIPFGEQAYPGRSAHRPARAQNRWKVFFRLFSRSRRS
jgi:hypothetical protein